MISEADIEKALDYLRDTAPEIAQARADMIFADEYRKSIKAVLMKEHADMPVSAQEREAYADQRYLDHIERQREAVKNYELLRARREAAGIKIEAWRSMNANRRSV